MEKFFCNCKKISLGQKNKTAVREKLVRCLKEKPLKECLVEVSESSKKKK